MLNPSCNSSIDLIQNTGNLTDVEKKTTTKKKTSFLSFIFKILFSD